jgi:hypothetical protein
MMYAAELQPASQAPRPRSEGVSRSWAWVVASADRHESAEYRRQSAVSTAAPVWRATNGHVATNAHPYSSSCLSVLSGRIMSPFLVELAALLPARPIAAPAAPRDCAPPRPRSWELPAGRVQTGEPNCWRNSGVVPKSAGRPTVAARPTSITRPCWRRLASARSLLTPR